MIFLIDFDGTLATKDTVDSLLELHAHPDWREIEAAWLAGKIDAPTCMSSQLQLVQATRAELEQFFLGIAIDPDFHLFRERAASFAHIAIVSDGLDYAIHTALQHHALKGIPVFANRLRFTAPDGLDLEFPYTQSSCRGGNGVCKCSIARQLAAEHGGPVVLIGDGKSDACLAGEADIVFAKGSLIRHCEAYGIPYTPFENFGELVPIVERWEAVDQFAIA